MNKEDERLLDIILKKDINLELVNDNQKLDLRDLEPQVPQIAQSRVHFGGNDKLIWPVMILYPETQQTDFIQNFHEDTMYVLFIYRNMLYTLLFCVEICFKLFIG